MWAHALLGPCHTARCCPQLVGRSVCADSRSVRGRGIGCEGVLCHKMSHECPSDQFEQEANQPRLCSNGCGFFANPACMNMCSKCYREQVSEQERLTANGKTAAAALNASRMDMGKPDSPVLPAPVPAALEPQSAPEPAKAEAQISAPDFKASEPAAVASSSAEKRRPVQTNTGRCFTCRKKIGLTGFQCRCEYFFCATHRYAEAHSCDFDYKAAGRQQLAKNNPLVQASKVDKL